MGSRLTTLDTHHTSGIVPGPASSARQNHARSNRWCSDNLAGAAGSVILTGAAGSVDLTGAAGSVNLTGAAGTVDPADAAGVPGRKRGAGNASA